MSKEQNPMSLENLPQYLKNQREKGDMGNAPVVNMGQLMVTEEKSWSGWARGLGVAVLMFMAMGVSIMSYNMLSPRQMTVIIDIDQNSDPSKAISQIVSESDGEIISVEHKKDTTYEVEVKTRKSKKSFLDWLLGKKGVKKAQLEE